MKTEIQRFYKKSNVPGDISGDYVEIKTSIKTFEIIQMCILDASLNGRDKERAKRIMEIFDKAKWEKDAIFY